MTIPLYNYEHQKYETTTLYSIEPIGLDTPYIESLSSYISRIAYEHNLRVVDLIKYIILPLLGKDYLISKECNGFFEGSHRINSLSTIAMQISDIISKLNDRSNIYKMTVWSWSNIIADTTVIRKHLSWCPKCFQEWRKQGTCIYIPYLWFFVPAEICALHNIALESECPNCHKQMPILARNSIPGFCCWCGAWLGSNSKKNLNKKTSYFLYQSWVTKQIGEMLSLNSIEVIDKTKLEINLLYLKEITFNKPFSKLFKRRITNWSKPGNLIELKSILELSYYLEIPVVDLIFQKIHIDESQVSKLIDKRVIEKDDKTNQRLDYAYLIEHALQFELLANCENPFPSLRQLSNRMGISEFIIRSKCPELSKQVAERHLKEYSAYHEQIRMQRCEKVRETVKTLDSQGIHPTLKKVKELVPDCFNFKGEGYKTWKQTCLEIGYLQE